MPSSKLLDEVFIAAPCGVRWDEMHGSATVRDCSQCSRKVYNLSAMTAYQAERFLEQAGSAECIGFYRRADGTILTADCPVGLEKIRQTINRRLRLLAASLSSIIAFFGNGNCSIAEDDCEQAPLVIKSSESSHKSTTNAAKTKTSLDERYIYFGVPTLSPPEKQKSKYLPVQATFSKLSPEKANEFADSSAKWLFDKAEEAARNKDYAIAKVYYNAALNAFDSMQVQTDPKFKNKIQEKLLLLEQLPPKK